MWVFSHNICVIDFELQEDKIINSENSFALDLKYENSDWKFTLLYRDNEESQKKLEPFINDEWGELIDLRIVPKDNLIYTDDDTLSIIENVEKVKLALETKLLEIEKILIKN